MGISYMHILDLWIYFISGRTQPKKNGLSVSHFPVFPFFLFFPSSLPHHPHHYNNQFYTFFLSSLLFSSPSPLTIPLSPPLPPQSLPHTSPLPPLFVLEKKEKKGIQGPTLTTLICHSPYPIDR